MTIKPYYDHAGIQIYLGDCLEIMPELEPVDLVVTSPPYNVGLKYINYIDDLNGDEFKEFTQDWLSKVYKISSEGTRAYIVVSEEMLFWLKPMAESIGWQWGQLLHWCKTNLVGGSGKFSKDWHMMSESILQFRKGKRTPMLSSHLTNCYNWITTAAPQRNFKAGRFNPAQYPEKLCQKLICRTPGKIILDPFMGSGTTLVAAKELERKAIGIELEEKDCEAAIKRLAQEPIPYSKRTLSEEVLNFK